MKGLLRKIFLEVRWPVFFFSLGLAVVMGLLTALLPRVLGEAHRMFASLPFIRPVITALLGMDPGNRFSAEMMQAFLWVHPSILTLIWAHELMYCSRMPAAEIDRGTADFLLALPVTRWKLYLSETIGWLISGGVIMAFGVAGYLLASSSLQPEMRPASATTLGILTNLAGVYVAVGGVSFLVSACSDRRGRAIGILFALLLASFLLNFLAQFWPPAKSVAFLSVMEHYRPAIIIQSGQFPLKDVVTLLTVALISWTIGGVIFRRRSICTV
ncbi:MAG: ABC transporter permease subunit [Planctomyces sp.]|jgi:ABC-2 type transport system permease protein